MLKSVCLLLALQLALTIAEEKPARQPKLFFVTSSTSTSISTTTSLLSSTLTCYLVSSTAYTACTGRKKRASSLLEQPVVDAVEAADIKISRVDRSVDSPMVESGVEDVKAEVAGNREAKFAWYYMTTTVTSTSTFTSTSTTFTSTVSVLLQSCTPSSFVACGGK